MDDSVHSHTLGLGFGSGGGDELLHDARKGTTIGPGAGGKVLGELGVEGAGLASRGMKAAIWVQVRRSRDKFLLQRHGPDQVEEEGLAAPVFADHDAEGRAAIRNAFNVLQQGHVLLLAAHLQQVQARARHHASPEGLNHCVTVSRADWCYHAFFFCTSSRLMSICSFSSIRARSNWSKAASLMHSMAPSTIKPRSAQSSSSSARVHRGL